MKRPKIKLMNCLVFITLIAFSISGYAQKGIPFITNYSLPVNMSTQNYQIIQGGNNTMHVLNQNGVFCFDGYNWERMPIAGHPIAITYIDKLFIGGDQVLGSFKKNLRGLNVYTPIENLNGELFYLFHHFNNNLYVAGVNGIYRIKRAEPHQVEPYYAEKDSNQIITDMFNIGDAFYIIKNKTSLYQIHKQDATPISVNIGNKEEFIFSFSHNNEQIIGTSANKIYRFNGKNFTQISIKDQNYLSASHLTNGISLNNKTFAFSTLIGGCIIINSDNGETKQIINYSCGLPDDEISSMGKDNLGGLWLIHGMGISRVDLSVPINSYHHIGGLNGNILSVAKSSSDLYVGTSDGLYKLVESRSYATQPTLEVQKPIEHKEQPKVESELPSAQKQPGKTKKGLFARIFGREKAEQVTAEVVQDGGGTINEKQEQLSAQKATTRKRVNQLLSINYSYEKIPGISGKVNQLASWNGNLLVASSTGLYNVYLNQPKPIISGSYIFCLNPSINDKSSFYVGTLETLYLITSNNNQWNTKELVSISNEKITSVAELSNNCLLVTTDYRAIKVEQINSSNPTVKAVDGGDGKLVSPIVRNINDKFLIITPTQVYQFYQDGDSIGQCNDLPKQDNYKVFYSNSNQTWIRVGQQWQNYPSNVSNKRIGKYLGLLDRVNYVSYTDSNEVWVINNYNQIYKLFPTKTNDTITNINLYVKQVIDKAGNSLNTNYVKLESDNNTFKIKLSAPFYLKEKAVEYQYKLEGVMSEWSDWGNTPERDFPFFPPGNHTLQFRARDAMGNISEIHEYPFSIKPPFYQTIWFYILVVAFAIAAVVVLVRIREQNLIKEKQILEQKVKERTKTIEEQKEAIEQQRDELKIRNSEILQQKEEIEAQRDEITAQRDQIISQNQDIIKSISYARRIQTAVMPAKEVTDSILKDYFILLKPRDIVSGDFFWMTRKDGKIVVTAADCTGHGVPGAFMSLLGITLLTEIVKTAEDLRPHTILNSLRANIKRTLSQVGREHEAKDGMDIALCVIDTNNNKLMYAGAYNPLYLVRNSELVEYKADKMPVGVHINEKETFTLHEIQIQKNDCIYMFSDGYIDQFGGNDNRKFMSKNFKELLLKVSPKEMAEQKVILDDTIDQWIGPHDQLDDILVMGIRF